MSREEILQTISSLLEDIHQADVLKMNSGERDLLAWDLEQLGVKYEINPNLVRVWIPEFPLEKRHKVLSLFRTYRLNLQQVEGLQEETL